MYWLAMHIYFERRRLTIAGILAFVAGFALHAHVNSMALGLPFPVFTGFLYAASVILTATMTTYLLPKMRWLTDSLAVSRLVFAIWVVGAHGQEVAASPLASAAIVVGGAILLLRIGDWIDKRSRALGAPVILLNIAALARTVLAWIDNKAMRECGVNVNVIGDSSTKITGRIRDSLVTA